MLLLLRVVVFLWAIGSVALAALAFYVLTVTYESSVEGAAYEGFEAIPEALMMMAGFSGSPVFVDVAYWVVLAASVLVTFGLRRR